MREFIHLPAKIHKNHTNWVPPIYMDEWTYFNPKKNRAFDHCTTILYVAEKTAKLLAELWESSVISTTNRTKLPMFASVISKHITIRRFLVH